MTPVVWTIAGSDSGGGAGIQADIRTCHSFNVHACSAITAFTAQNTYGVSAIQSATVSNVKAQILALKNDIPPNAIKLGMLFSSDLIQCIADLLSNVNVPIIADPVLVSSNGDKLCNEDFIEAYRVHIIPLATLITPNVHEAAMLTGTRIASYEDMTAAAARLLEQGAQSVLIKGGDFHDPLLASDFFTDGEISWWINQTRIDTNHTHGTGCVLSCAIAAAISQGWLLSDAIVLAKAYVHAGLTSPSGAGSGRQGIGHTPLCQLKKHFPWVTSYPQSLPKPFKPMPGPIGRYPVVDNLEDLGILCTKGITCIQLRIKDPHQATEEIFKKALAMTSSFGVILFINDYIDMTKKLNAPALHLGQEDVVQASLHTIDPSQIFLGVSAHNLLELARAYAYHPSYLTMGPIFHTQSKKMRHPLIGLSKLAFVASLCPLPLVAIGGISFEETQTVLNLGCSGAAFIQASQQLKHEGRYDRHLSLPAFSVAMQQRLMSARILYIGVGGLASGCLPYLASAGVGDITLIDYDTVSHSNLQRQILFSEKDIGKIKVECAAQYLRALNTTIKIHAKRSMVIAKNATELLKGYDLIIDGTDNYDTHYLISDTAKKLGVRVIAGAVFREKGHLFYFEPGSLYYRDFFPDAGDCLSCEDAGVVGTMPGMVGILQAHWAISLLTKQMESTSSNMLNITASASMRFQMLSVSPHQHSSC